MHFSFNNIIPSRTSTFEKTPTYKLLNNLFNTVKVRGFYMAISPLENDNPLLKNTLKLYIKSRAIKYQGPMMYEQIKVWIEDWVYLIVKEIRSEEDFMRFMLKEDRIPVVAVYDEESEKEVQVLEKLVKSGIIRDSGNFWVGRAFSSDFVTFPEEEIKTPSLLMYLQKDDDNWEIKHFGGDFKDLNQILDFIQLESMDLVSHFGEDTIFRIFGGPVLSAAFLFLDPEFDNDEIEKEFYKVAKFNKEEGYNFQNVSI